MSGGWDISVVGPGRSSGYWNGASAYFREIVRALALRGHRVTVHEPSDAGSAFLREHEPEGARVAFYRPDDDGDVDRVAADSARADVVLLADAGHADSQRPYRAIADAAPRGMVVLWDLDPPATLDRLTADGGGALHELLPRLDLILTYDGGVEVARAYGSLGARRCVPVADAFDPRSHRPALSDLRFAGDLGLIANRVPPRERRIERLFFEPARRLPASLFVLAGTGWNGRPLPLNVGAVGHVYEREQDAFFASTRAALVIAGGTGRYAFSIPHRLIDAAGCGACVITDAGDGIEAFLEPETEVLVARDGVEVTEHVRELTSGRAAAIGMLARRRILSEHTYAHRARQIEDALGDAGVAARRGAA